MQPGAVLNVAAALAECLSKVERVPVLHGFKLDVPETTGPGSSFSVPLWLEAAAACVRVQTPTAKYVKNALAATDLDTLFRRNSLKHRTPPITSFCFFAFQFVMEN